MTKKTNKLNNLSNKVLMPKATALWLVENTALTFDQIGKFCGLHVLEVKSIADGNENYGVQALDPVFSGQLDSNEIARCEADPAQDLRLKNFTYNIEQKAMTEGSRYIPLVKRQDRPNAILWLVRKYPDMPDSQICSLIKTTRTTVKSIREGYHWNIRNLTPQDPVALGLCSQNMLDSIINDLVAKREKAKSIDDSF